MWLCKRPRVLSFPNFLSGEECLKIMQLARAEGLEPDSPVTDDHPSIRTSSCCWLAYNRSEEDYGCRTRQDEQMLRSIADRISVASCLPEAHGETFQILRYTPGQHYKRHPDFFTKHQREELSMGGQRLATMLLYLTDVPQGGGGETHFPHATMHHGKKGLSIRPEAGLGILFFNTSPDNRIDPASMHESLPVKPGAEKWTLTRWIRQRPYPRPRAQSSG